MEIYLASFVFFSFIMVTGYAFSLTVGKGLPDQLNCEIVLSFYLTTLTHFLIFAVIISFLNLTPVEIDLARSFSHHPISIALNVLGVGSFLFFLAYSLKLKVWSKKLVIASLQKTSWKMFACLIIVLVFIK